MVYLNNHLKKYPLMQIEDIIKLHLQGILGPTHLIQDFDRLKKGLISEYESIKDSTYQYEMYEEISDDYIRVNLKPYYEKYHSFDGLIEGFKLSLNTNVDINHYIEEIKKLKNKDNEEFIDKYLESKNYIMSHSSVYKENYFPHYLIINKKYKGVTLYEI